MGDVGALAKGRLVQERKQWRRDKPFGFHARPESNADGSVNMMKWKCYIPGKQDTEWEGGYFPLTMEFCSEYPAKPPKCKFPAAFYHPNIYPSGTVCLSILNEEEGWRPSITIKQILLGIYDLMTDPNPLSPAQSEAYMHFQDNKIKYAKLVQEQAKRYPPPS